MVESVKLMGAAWAYEALSFAGYWSWDPVENASLVPWLAACERLSWPYAACGPTYMGKKCQPAMAWLRIQLAVRLSCSQA